MENSDTWNGQTPAYGMYRGGYGVQRGGYGRGGFGSYGMQRGGYGFQRGGYGWQGYGMQRGGYGMQRGGQFGMHRGVPRGAFRGLGRGRGRGASRAVAQNPPPPKGGKKKEDPQDETEEGTDEKKEEHASSEQGTTPETPEPEQQAPARGRGRAMQGRGGFGPYGGYRGMRGRAGFQRGGFPRGSRGRGRGRGRGGQTPAEIEARQKRRHEQEKKQHIELGAEESDTGALMFTGMKEEKIIPAQGPIQNAAEKAVRPNLKQMTYAELKEDWLTPVGSDETVHKPDIKFVKGDDEEHDQIIMVSFPRSGNTMLRAYCEKILGVATGSDGDIRAKLIGELMQRGLAGEGLVDKRVLVIKSHYPERWGSQRFYAERAVLLVRNPIDCITSLFNMVCTGTHNRSIIDSDFKKFALIWMDFLQQDISVWKDFHDFWLKAKIPVHIIRYEDICEKPFPVLKSLMQFITNTEDITGTRLEKYIQLATSEDSPEIYKPREGKVNGNLAKFNRVQLDYLYSYAANLLQAFGYQDIYLNAGADETVPPEKQQEYIRETLQLQIDARENFISEFNKLVLKKSIHQAQEAEEITSLYVNYPPLLLRAKSELYPEGRMSHRVKLQIRDRCTIVDRNQQPVDESERKMFTDVDAAEKEVCDEY